MKAVQTFRHGICPYALAAALPLLVSAQAAAEDVAGPVLQVPQLPAAASATNEIAETPEFQFATGARYAITAAVMHVTDIALQPGEEIRGEIAIGDTVRWVASVDKRDSAQHHVFIKPVKAGLSTNMIVRTSRRTYLLDLRSSSADASYMVTVGWKYPSGDERQTTSDAVNSQQ